MDSKPAKSHLTETGAKMMEQIMQGMMKKVEEFHDKMGIPINNGDGFPDRTRYDHLIEELNEIIDAHQNADRCGVVDGLVDLIYVAIGALLQAGVHPNLPFDAVHEANMKKVGMRTARHEHDAVKPDGWQPPDIGAVLEQQEILRQVSPVFVDLTRLKIKKGNNYNRGNVKRMDHFPLGDLSFFQVVWMKMCRVRSLTENPGTTEEERRESRRLVERELNDIVVYGGFWLEFIRGIEI